MTSEDAPGLRQSRRRPGLCAGSGRRRSAHVVVHARTKVDGCEPPAHWEWVARVAEAVRVPVFANG
ncbi:tRNA-dihydrouridine synthase, partial [Pseudomonas aeruginosa]|nr:tRNA-dihydrouridine synthase [Pseudomonas aeruginosa]